MLYIVATPIGNLKDITLRALEVLKSVDLIAAEDTRQAQKLLQAYEITRPVVSYHSHSGFSRCEKILEVLKGGRDVALISDAGTPGISDPGFVLIREALSRGIQVSPIPGACAAIAGLSVSGLSMHHFMYLGFLPLKKGRQTLLKSLQAVSMTVVIYEAPHRLLKTLKDILEFVGERPIAVCRELTKMHEEIFRGGVSEALAHFQAKGVKGEIVLVLGKEEK